MDEGDDLDIIEVVPAPCRNAASASGDVVVYEVHDSDSEYSDVADDSSVVEILDYEPAESSAAGVETDTAGIVTAISFDKNEYLEFGEGLPPQKCWCLDMIEIESRRRVSLPNMESPVPLAEVAPVKREGMTLITWNVDGLNQDFLHQRISAICRLTLSWAPDVIYLQEIVPEIEPEIRLRFPQYLYLPGDRQGYYVATLLNKNTVNCTSHSVVPFSSTKMERHIIFAEATFNGKPVVLLNTHLESMGYSTEVRQVQLRRCFRMCRKEAAEKTVIFGGDLNLRDREVDSIGGVPGDVQDMWVASGSDPSCRYTWDMERNDNLDFRDKGKPQLRFDRVYVRHSLPPSLSPTAFRLIGTRRLEREGCFPSDHWGIVCQFKCS
ncbi:tyrosyl-DNA phosphodiesterase 2-like isoform X1 [Haemaphysalis longicornis]